MKALKKCKFFICMFTCIILLSGNIFAKSNSYSPTSEFFVNDFANILSAETEKNVFDTGVQIQENTTAQLVVTTVPNMDGSDIESYTNQMYNEWKIGSKDKDNGILVLISKDERKIRIEVGYGLEGAINDAKAGRLIDDVAIPSLKNNDYDTAVKNIIYELQGIIYNEYGVEGGFDNYAGRSTVASVIMTIFSMLIVVMIIIGAVLGKGRRGFFFFGGPPFGGFGGGGFHGGGGFGGFGGGGFSGGGGSSGGGGASRGF